MTIKIVKVLVATVALGALILGTAPSMARPGGGGPAAGGIHLGILPAAPGIPDAAQQRQRDGRHKDRKLAWRDAVPQRPGR